MSEQGPAAGEGTTDTTPDGGNADGAESFKAPQSQAELDRIIQSRVARAEKAARQEFADYADLKKFKESHETDAEKIRADAIAEGEKAATERLTKVIAASEVKTAALSLKFRDPSDALAHFGDLGEVVKGEAVDADAVTKRLQAIAESKPYLLNTDDAPAARPGRQRIKRDTSQTDTAEGDGKRKSAVELIRAHSRSI